MHLSLSISELHQRTYFHCSLLWCEIGIVYQQVIYLNIGVISYLFTKFHASKHSGKRVTQTCMSYFNIWAEVVFCGFPKSKVFTQALICLFTAHHQTLYLYQVSYVGVLC